jgi:hypothetical protein
MWHVWEGAEVHIGFWWGCLRKGHHLEYLCVDGLIIFKWIFKKWNGLTGLIWFRIGIGEGLF